MMYARDYDELELQPGVVVFLRPTDFPAYWTRWTCEGGGVERVAGDHYFIVLGCVESGLVMAPAFSSPKPYRVEVGDKSGLPRWVNRRTFFDPCQLLVVPVAAVIARAVLAGDETWPGRRNHVGHEGLIAMVDAVYAHMQAIETSGDGAA